MSDQDARFMAMALAMGARAMGRTWPNPAVGCVIVKEGRVLGRGATAPSGRPHAEPQALAQAGDAAKGATAYVTLEPCAHHGKTPPCADSLIAAGLARVVIAHQDPDPRTAGAGAARLAKAGIAVEMGVLQAEAAQDHAGFFLRVTKGRPLVTLKMAQSLDGKIALANGQSRWITGPLARRQSHMMRARHDAVMIGAGTARADDPDLTVRDLGSPHQPLRIVVSRRLDLPRGGRLEASIATAPLWLIHGPEARAEARDHWRAQGAVLHQAPVDASGQMDIAAVMALLGDQGLTRVFCEGGGALAAALLQGDLVDHLVAFGAGFAIGAEGRPSIGALGLSDLAEARRFELHDTRPLGGDVMTRWRRV